MARTRKFVAHAVLAVGCFLLAGCVLAEMHATVSPVPPYFDLTVKGLVDNPPPPPTHVVATFATEPATQP